MSESVWESVCWERGGAWMGTLCMVLVVGLGWDGMGGCMVYHMFGVVCYPSV